MLTRRAFAAGALSASAASCAPARSQPLHILIGSTPGAASDRIARILARHITRKFGQPVEVSNEGRANGKMASQRLVAAKPDGLTIGFLSTGLLYGALLHDSGGADSLDKIQWLGSLNYDRRVLIVTKASGVERFEDLIGRRKPLILICGATSQSSYYECRILDYLTDANVRIVPGFRGGTRNLALISGEGEAVIGTLDGLEPALEQAGSKIILRMNRLPVLGLSAEKGSQAPTIDRFAKGPDAEPLIDLMNAHAQLGRIVGLPPGTPPDLVAQWRERFAAVIADPAFVTEANAAGFLLEPTPGAAVNATLSRLLSTGANGVGAALGRAMACQDGATCA